jgi:glycerol-3-phosphate cytidylyltransferase
MIYCFDLDGTICTSVKNSEYELAQPDPKVIENINSLYEHGHIIKIMTARGCVSNVDHTELTKRQLSEWTVFYHELIMNVKPHADFFIDDKAINIYDWKKQFIHSKFGIVAGAFDIIHPGYIKMFKEAKLNCDNLTVALHIDPSINHKLKVVQSLEDREEILRSIRYVDNVIRYADEHELYLILNSGIYDIRFLGSDYKYDTYTGKDLDLPIYWISRDHDYSTTSLKFKIKESL